MKISLIVPVYNAEKDLRKCVESLLAQTHKDIEVILVNDGSTDESGKICDDFKDEDNRVKVIHQENAGVSAARNAALMCATGDYIGFADSDDYASENMYSVLLDASLKHDADMVLCGTNIIGGIMFDKEGYERTNHTFEKETVFDTSESLEKLLLGTIGAPIGVYEDSEYGTAIWKNLYKTSLIKDNNITFLSQTKYGSEDLLFLVDCMMNAKKVVGIPGAYYYHFHNNSSLSNARTDDRFSRAVLLNELLCEKLSEKVSKEKYRFSTDRLLLSSARAASTQEILYAINNPSEKKHLKKRLLEICSNEKVQDSFKRFPYMRLPIMQAIYTFALKYRLTGLQTVLVRLRRKI